MDTSLLSQLAALPEMEATEMKALWKRLYQKPPPPFNRSNYIKRLAYRIQELAYGVDSRKLEKRPSCQNTRWNVVASTSTVPKSA